MVLGGTVPNRIGLVALGALILALPGLAATAAAQDVEWTNLANVSVSGTTLQKTSGCDGCDDGGAQSQQQIDSPGGYVEFTVGETNTFWIGGLSNGNNGPSYGGIDFAFRFNGFGGADVLQNGYYRGGDTSYAPGDVFGIAVAYGRSHASRNGPVVDTIRVAATYPLVLDVAFGTIGASLFDAQLSHDLVGDPPPPPPPLTGSNITWTDLVNVTPGESVLQKTDGCGGCDDAGAWSQEEIESGDGYVEFTVGEINTFWVAGLSHGNTDTSFGDIDFGFRFNGAGVADVLENGVYRGGDTPYTVGDVFRLEVVHGHVYYRHNGEVVYASDVMPTYPLVLDTALGTADATIYNANLVVTSTTFEDNGEEGGLLETAGQQPFRPRYTTGDIDFLPPDDATGAFWFPSPYQTRGVRLTNGDECGPDKKDCVLPIGYSYWRRINDYPDSDDTETMYILLGLEANRDGTGPTLFSFNKTTEHVQNLGGLFVCRQDEDPSMCADRDPDGGYRRSTAEMWYFSARKPKKLYAFSVGGKQLRRFDIGTRTFDLAPAMDLAQCPADVCPANARAITQPHSSDDDNVHSATVVDESDQDHPAKLGCVVYREDASAFRFFPVPSGLDECALDKGGRWLVIHVREDNLIVDLENPDDNGTLLPDAAGAHGHADLGYGYSVGSDDQNAKTQATTLIKFPLRTPLGEAVHFNDIWSVDGGAANHVSHTNAKPGLPPEQQYACASNAQHAVNSPRRDEIVCFMLNPHRNVPVGDPPESPLDILVVAPVMTDLDDPDPTKPIDPDLDYQRRPKGNLAVTGDYFIWTTNLGSTGNRLDAFIVKIPKTTLLRGRP